MFYIFRMSIAVLKEIKKAKMKLSDMQAVEINEAFAAQVLACLRALESDSFAKEFVKNKGNPHMEQQKLEWE